MTANVHTVFAAQNNGELAAGYDDWSASYEADMGDHGGPREAVDAIARFAGTNALILDAGCGTGLAGELLAAKGYQQVDGLDLSPGMLREAGKKGCYRALYEGALGDTLEFPSGSYDAVMSVGVFVRAHAPASSLDELVRITKPGGYVIFTLRPEFYEGSPFKAKMDELVEAGAWSLAEKSAPFNARYREFPDINLQVWVFRRAAVMPLPEWNETQVPLPADTSVIDLIEAQAERTPNAIALYYRDEQLTYRDFNAQANQVANYLLATGIQPGARIGLCIGRTPEMLIALVGILKAGAAYVPIDPLYPRARQELIGLDSGLQLLMTQQDLVGTISLPGVTTLCLDSQWATVAEHRSSNPKVAVSPDSLFCVLYTSGSTGRPKGVMDHHRGILNFMLWMRSMLPEGAYAGAALTSSLCFDVSIMEIFPPLTCGGAIIVAENLLALPTLPAREQITFVNAVSSAMGTLLRIDGVPRSVRHVVLCGEAVSGKVVRDLYGLGTIQTVINGWGPTETTVMSTTYRCERDTLQNPPIGKPIFNTMAYILDDAMRIVPVGTAGELCIGGTGVTFGYWNRPDLTADRFQPNPFGEGKIYRTGDLARYLPDGTIEYLGRIDFQVKIRGHRIELGEVETTLERHPAVDQAIVMALPDTAGDIRLASYILANPAELERMAKERDESESVALWGSIYDEFYQQARTSGDPTFNINGWISSYTNTPIPEVEMREWVNGTVDRILALKPRKLLEIGCGTGLFVVRVAPHCQSYIALDPAPAGLENIRSLQKTMPQLENVVLLERYADQLDDFAPGSFDTVIMNSVMQVFPDCSYFLEVFAKIVPLVAPGGRIFIGDCVNLATLETLQTSLQLVRARDEAPAQLVRQRIVHEVGRERDLAVGPGMFPALAAAHREISHVQVMPRRGRILNELSRFRFDAILHVGGPVPLHTDLPVHDWQAEGLSLAAVRDLLAGGQTAALALANIPNRRLSNEILAMAWLKDPPPSATMAMLRTDLAQNAPTGIDPEELWDFEALGYRTELSWLGSGTDGILNAVLTRADLPPAFADFHWAKPESLNPADHANHSRRNKTRTQLIRRLREFLKDRLPRYMIPSAFLVLDAFPVTLNSKIDRNALAKLPIGAALAQDDAPAETDNPLELMLLDSWADVLDLDRLGLNDDFFELGGDSLKAAILIHRLNVRLGRDIRMDVLMQAPTVTSLAALLRSKTLVEVEEGVI